eukprot:Gregarina_sp_Pseudo_9__2924@NODE_313_length_3190_cov_36_799429_g294_i0_p2_GENE_NODE_313_length_3190_cov_36_799429_g294_i0NODE_313_length_3190_cov_36_799429_g294_i0_p2_ORF_typecomplete_len468_score76_47VATPase_H_C/PF11698_8/3_2e02VATPase_H_C/PF11698_8/4_1e34VATPase_H_N/PF03224_14/8_2e21VATPase_H_N/PF03224_14/1_6e03Arm/PF00514_23/0_51Arm/PF00514_23/5_8e02Arm/PF00514_23/6e02_NODE_313_length_3190_cov_36_799429_g294_i017513154
MPKESTPSDSYEKLRLLGQLAGDDVKAVASGLHLAEKPDWRKLESTGEVPRGAGALFDRIADLDLEARLDALRSDPSALDMYIQALMSIDKDANAVMYLSECLVDLCKIDSMFWDTLAETTFSNNLTCHTVCWKSLEKNWAETQTNDNLGYLLCGVQSHCPKIEDTHNLCKVIVDPKVLRMSPMGRLAATANLLKDDVLRHHLFNSSTCRGLISQGLTSRDLGTMYQAALCFWLFTFNDSITKFDGHMYRHRTVLDNFCDLLQTCKREKVVRVACLAIKNVIDIEWIFEFLCHKKLDHALTLLEYEKWRDQELYESIQELLRIFYIKTREYTNVSRYLKELNSGRLQPGPLHAEKFWRENVTEFENNEFAAIGKLSDLLKDANSDPQTLSVALFDLGEFSRLHATGKKVLQKFGTKNVVFALMSHSNKEVAREALLCTQKLMLDDWRQLGGEQQEKHTKGGTLGSPA